MSGAEDVAPPPSEGYYLCDLARTSREFSIADLATGEIFEVASEIEARDLVSARYPGARLVLSTSTRQASPDGQGIGPFVIVAVARIEGDACSVVAYVGGAVHGARCVPFSPIVWHDAIDLLGLSRAIEERHARLREIHASWRRREDPHPYRERAAGEEWPVGPPGGTCADCGRDPRDALHRVAADPSASSE